jgi:hypothetical protein
MKLLLTGAPLEKVLLGRANVLSDTTLVLRVIRDTILISTKNNN